MKLLLHICCGPCTCYPLKDLRQQGIEPVGYFFNPNIHPYKEWDQRMKTAQEFAAKTKFELVIDKNYYLREFLLLTLDIKEPDDIFAPRRRCLACYGWRLNAAAKYAKDNGFDAFSTTLLYSIHQQHNAIKEAGLGLAKKYNIDFYYADWRLGWQEGIDISREMELYRQSYCGCIFSEEERYSRAIKKARQKAGKLRKHTIEETTKETTISEVNSDE